MFLKYLYCIVSLILISTSSIAQKIDSHFFELLDFNRQELKKTAEYVGANNLKVASKELLSYYRKKNNTFLNIGSEDLDYIESKYKQEVEESIETANQVLNQNFLFRYEWDMEKTNVPYQFKKEIDWSLIPFGDEEWCFMLNRHKFWIDLGKAYLFTGKEKYAEAFVNQVTHWIDNNPQDKSLKSLTWRRIEAGIRCENWIKSFEYIKNSKHVTPEFLIKFLKSLHQHAEYINSSFNYFSKTSNWGVIEYNGLFTLSNVLSEFKKSAKWGVESIEKLTTCINLQVLSVSKKTSIFM